MNVLFFSLRISYCTEHTLFLIWDDDMPTWWDKVRRRTQALWWRGRLLLISDNTEAEENYLLPDQSWLRVTDHGKQTTDKGKLLYVHLCVCMYVLMKNTLRNILPVNCIFHLEEILTEKRFVKSTQKPVSGSRMLPKPLNDIPIEQMCWQSSWFYLWQHFCKP